MRGAHVATAFSEPLFVSSWPLSTSVIDGRRWAPVFFSMRAHFESMVHLVPTALSESDVVDDDAAFEVDAERPTLQGRFVEPALLLGMQTLRLVLEARSLHDDHSQQTLLRILARFAGPDASDAPGSATSHSSVPP